MSDQPQEQQPSDAKATHQPTITLNVRSRTVDLRIFKPLDLAPTELTVPFAVWKEVAANIMQFENAAEMSAPASRPRIVRPG